MFDQSYIAMKLLDITERLQGSKDTISKTSRVLGDLITYLRDKDGPIVQAMAKYLQKPSPDAWKETAWIVDKAAQSIAGEDPERAKEWMQLKELSAPVAAAAPYDVDRSDAIGTPLQQVTINRGLNNKAKKALGPQGYVAALGNAGELPHSKLKHMLKQIGNDGQETVQAIKRDIPQAKLISRF